MLTPWRHGEAPVRLARDAAYPVESARPLQRRALRACGISGLIALALWIAVSRDWDTHGRVGSPFAGTFINTPAGLVAFEEWERANPGIDPRGSMVLPVCDWSYGLQTWGWLPPLTERAEMNLRCVVAGGAAYNGDISVIRDALEAILRRGVQQELSLNGAQSAAWLDRGFELAGYGQRAGVSARPYWPGIAYLTGVIAPLAAGFLLSVWWAIRAMRRAFRAERGGNLCGRCLYPLTVPQCDVCPECGTPVRWGSS